MNQNRNRSIAIAGVFSALVVVMCITPLGYIPINPTISYTILHVPVVFGAILGGPIAGMIVGAVFGLTSLIKAAIAPGGLLGPLMVNPIVSVFPRIMIGLVTWLVFYGLQKVRLPKILAGVVAAYFGSFTNTVLVFFTLCHFNFISVFAKNLEPEKLEKLQNFINKGFGVLFGTNFPGAFVEASICAFLVAAVLSAMVVKGRKSKLNSESEEE